MAPPDRRVTPPARPRKATTFVVRIWQVRKFAGKTGTTYRVRWMVGGEQKGRSFATRALADRFRSELVAATNRGELFDVESGLPVSQVPADRTVRWWDWALTFTELKWDTLAPTSRRSITDALTQITLGLCVDGSGRPTEAELRHAMLSWAFVVPRRLQGPPPDDLAAVVSWLGRNTVSMADLDDAALVRSVLDRMTKRLDGTPVAATTIARRRAAFFNALEFAVERELIPANPLRRVRWKAPKVSGAVDPVSVVNPSQARALLQRVGEVPKGDRLVAMFGCMYYAAARPGEAIELRLSNLQLPDQAGEWGWLRLSHNNPSVPGAFSDGGRREFRQLKHRAVGDIRMVPCAPALVELLKRHLDRFGAADDGRLFRGPLGGTIRDEEYLGVWRAAREAALTPAEQKSPLAARPYDLRHACVSTWLAADVDSTQVANWAGHSVAVLHRVYAHVVSGREDVALGRISLVLGEGTS
jgi:integrase